MSEQAPRRVVTPDGEPHPPQAAQPEAMPEPIIATHEESTAATEPISPETPLTPEEQHDAANRFTDAELLGRSYPVRRLVKTIGNERVHAWESAKAGVANAWDTPGKLIRQGLHDRASRKVDEINANHKAERDAALQSGVSNRLLQHRLNRIDKKYNRKKRN